MSNIIKYIKQHKIIAVLLVLILATTIALCVFLNRKTATVQIKVAPHDAVVLIDQQQYQNNTSVNFRPGQYTAVISKDGFQDKSIDFTLDDGQTLTLSAYLTEVGTDDNGFEYYETNYDDLYFLRDYSNRHPEDNTLTTFLNSFDRAATIKEILPVYYYDVHSSNAYYIFFDEKNSSCSKIYCLEIGASNDEYYNRALQEIINRGYDPDFYQMTRVYD